MQPEPKCGQIWKECDPRFVRFVRIEKVVPGRRGISIRAVAYAEGAWIDTPKSRLSYADPSRFNGKRGGYQIHQA